MTYRYPGSAYQKRIERLGDKEAELAAQAEKHSRRVPTKEEALASIGPQLKTKIDAIIDKECKTAGVTAEVLMAKKPCPMRVTITRRRIYFRLSTQLKVNDFQIAALFDRQMNDIRFSIEHYRNEL